MENLFAEVPETPRCSSSPAIHDADAQTQKQPQNTNTENNNHSREKKLRRQQRTRRRKASAHVDEHSAAVRPETQTLELPETQKINAASPVVKGFRAPFSKHSSDILRLLIQPLRHHRKEDATNRVNPALDHAASNRPAASSFDMTWF